MNKSNKIRPRLSKVNKLPKTPQHPIQLNPLEIRLLAQQQLILLQMLQLQMLQLQMPQLQIQTQQLTHHLTSLIVRPRQQLKKMLQKLSYE